MFRRAKRHRRSGSLHSVQKGGGDVLHYEAPSSLSSATSFLTALRDVAVIVCPHQQDTSIATSTATSVSNSSIVSRGSEDRRSDDGEDECALCLGELSDENVSMIQTCKHSFHEDCIRDWLGRTPHCPICRGSVRVLPQGYSPSGTMKIQTSTKICPGFSHDTTCIEITYYIPSSIQHSFHDNPGTRFGWTTRVAFLPNNEDGRLLLCRLKFAFAHGLTFTVGTSISSGWHNSVVWTRAFDHKTTLQGGAHGFPDPHYLSVCNAQLDAMGIPSDQQFDQPVQENEVVLYTAPDTLGPPILHHDVLQPVPRAAIGNADTDDESQSFVCVAATAAASSSHCHQRRVSTASSALDAPDEACPICFEALSLRSATQINMCDHVFHRDCIETSLRHDPRCPVCRRRVNEPLGHSPSGTMAIKCLRVKCPGFHRARAIEISYNIPSGTQLEFHEHPGVPFTGTYRLAYLPDTDEGCRLLTRLQYAWTHGLTFTVGTSLTTGLQNTVTWSSIPHKTTLDGGVHGFPDPHYITNCNNSLDALGVPDADTCFTVNQPQVVVIDALDS